ncbi:MAG: hypothetical protein ACLTE2_04175 [Eubacteriales bacterium]
MFRRDEQAVTDWSLEHVKTCAVRQAAILDSAAQAVKENGILVYSTCTFSKEENEDTVSAFLERVIQKFESPGKQRCYLRAARALVCGKNQDVFILWTEETDILLQNYAESKRIQSHPKLFTPKQKQDVKLAEELS